MTGEMLLSAAFKAFRSGDARLGYDNARIDYDANNCAVYSATGPDGQPFSEPLRGADGTRLCTG